MSRRITRSGELPLFRWAESLRQDRANRARLGRRLQLGLLGTAAMAVSILVPPQPLLLWNASASVPIGLYAVIPGYNPGKGDMAVANLPEPYRSMAARRHYLPRNVPLVKRVGGAQGDLVCAAGSLVTVNGILVVERLAFDPHGLPLPRWEGCRIIGKGALFLLSADVPDAFDGRYFGIIPADNVVGEARLLWRR
jgi:conjugative transfer signal peptidase TraF